MLIKCPECGNMVSDRAAQCPKCGYEVMQESSSSNSSIYSTNVTGVPGEGNSTLDKSEQGCKTTLQTVFTVFSFLCYAFAIVDVVLFYIFDIDLTGSPLSPLISSALGAVFSAVSSKV